MNKRPTKKQLENVISQLCDAEDYDCRSAIMNHIRSGRTKTRSRWLVLSEELGLRTTWILGVFLLIAIINLFLYMLSQSPEWEFIEFGASGLGVVIEHFPYGWMAILAVLVAFSLLAMKRFSWSYLFPFKLFSVLLIAGVFMAGGVAFATGVNERLYQKLVEEPGAGNSLLAKLYCLCTNRSIDSDSALMGEVLHIDQDEFVVQTPQLEIVTVSTSDAAVWLDEAELELFKLVKMLGERTADAEFVASHVKVHDAKGLELVRDEEDCEDKSNWKKKREVAEQRRQAILQPYTPSMGIVQFVQSY